MENLWRGKIYSLVKEKTITEGKHLEIKKRGKRRNTIGVRKIAYREEGGGKGSYQG